MQQLQSAKGRLPTFAQVLLGNWWSPSRASNGVFCSAGVVTIARAPIVQQRTSLHSAPTRVRVGVPRMRLSKYSSTLSCMAFSALQLDAIYCAIILLQHQMAYALRNSAFA
jgi:hypothetical protein